MLKQRIISAVVGVPLVILVTWFGNPWFGFFIAAIALVGTFEFYRMAKLPCPPGRVVGDGVISRSLVYFGLAWSLAIVLNPLLFYYHAINCLPLVVTVGAIGSLVWILCQSPREKAFYKWAWLVAGVVYVGWLLSYWLNLRVLDEGRGLVYLAVFTIFASDTGAFFIGRRWGKHHMASTISPGKTWEGALGGGICAVLAAILVANILDFISFFPVEWWQILLLGCLISLFTQLGDLVESLLKRNAGVKDSGSFLPGHGGILDRFDGLIFVGPVVYYYVLWVM